MTVNSTTSKAGPYSGNDATTVFPFSFRILDETHLRVFLTDADGVDQADLVLGAGSSNYSVAGVGDASGSVTYPASGGTPLPTGWKLTILRDVPFTQLTDIANAGAFYPEVHETVFDKLTMMAQQNAEGLERAIKVSAASDQTPEELLEELFTAAADAIAASELAEEWATKTPASVDGGTGYSAKLWAQKTGATVDGTDYSAKQYALNAEASADNAAVSEANAAASAAAAEVALSSALWRDVVFVTSNYVATSADNGKLLRVSTASGNVTITLPLISGLGVPFNIGVKKESADGNSVIINRSGSDLIDGGTSKTILAPSAGTTLLADTDPTPDEWTATDFGAVAGNLTSDTFSGTGAQTAFTLTVAPGSVNNVAVFIDGVRQYPTLDYTVSGATLTFGSAPPLGTNNILAVIGTTLSIGVPANATVARTHLTAAVSAGVPLTPEEYGAVGNGVADDTTAAQAAVAAAYASGRELQWNGTYLTTASIPNFHDVVHIGDGSIVRGSDTFRITPKGSAERNIIYFAPSGSGGNNANDGLSSSQPKYSLPHLVDVLEFWQNLGRTMGGRWRFKFASGTWSNQQMKFSYQVRSTWPIELYGTATYGSIINLSGAAAFDDCVWIRFGGQFEVRDFLFDGKSSTEGFGYLHEGGGRSDVYDSKAQNCNTGFGGTDGARITTSACVADTCTTGYNAGYNALYSFGRGTAPEGCTATNCAQGAFITRNAVGHIDYLTATSCSGAGILLDASSRANVTGCDLRLCGVGILSWEGSTYVVNSTTYNMGTGNACTVAYRHMDASRETRLYGQTSQIERRVCAERGAPISTLTGTTARTFQFALRDPLGGIKKFPAYFFADSYKTMRIRIFGTKTGTAGALTVDVGVVGDNSDYTANVNPNLLGACVLGTTAGRFILNLEITALTYNTQVSFVQGLSGINVPFSGNGGAGSADFSTDRSIRMYCTLGNAADTVVINGYDLYLIG